MSVYSSGIASCATTLGLFLVKSVGWTIFFKNILPPIASKVLNPILNKTSGYIGWDYKTDLSGPGVKRSYVALSTQLAINYCIMGVRDAIFGENPPPIEEPKAQDHIVLLEPRDAFSPIVEIGKVIFTALMLIPQVYFTSRVISHFQGGEFSIIYGEVLSLQKLLFGQEFWGSLNAISSYLQLLQRSENIEKL